VAEAVPEEPAEKGTLISEAFTMMTAMIGKENIEALFEILGGRYRIIGPKVVNGAVVLTDISFADIPAGYRDHQGAGTYRLEEQRAEGVFTFSPGPDSLKKFLHPSSEKLFVFRKTAKNIVAETAAWEGKPMAFVGVRACDLAALGLLDKVFLEGPVRERGYERRRKDIFIVAVNCVHPGENCFCASMGTGPEAKEGFDIVLTELPRSFLIETGSIEGENALEKLPHGRIENGDLDEKRAALSRCREKIRKSMKTDDLPGIIYRNMEHPVWAEIAARDLECGNCTMVCPTCFCTSSYDILTLSSVSGNFREFSGLRKRTWDSCFSKNFARVHGGNFRPSRRARYRHWMTHKLAYWIDQFGRPGCVGCGRCITWCPVGIDITRELEGLRRVR
jgi:sulfhydrogenase subunit beta (sulfur reductase)